MISGRYLSAMAQSHDIHHESHHGKRPPPSMLSHYNCNRHNIIIQFNKNNIFHVRQGSRLDMVNNKGVTMIKQGKNDKLEMN